MFPGLAPGRPCIRFLVSSPETQGLIRKASDLERLEETKILIENIQSLIAEVYLAILYCQSTLSWPRSRRPGTHSRKPQKIGYLAPPLCLESC